MAVYTAADSTCTWNSGAVANYKRATVSHTAPEKAYATAGSSGIDRKVGHVDSTAQVEVYVDNGGTPLPFTLGQEATLTITGEGSDNLVTLSMVVLSIEYSPDVETADLVLAVVSLARA